MVRRAKIVCTIGPGTSSRSRLKELVDAGMNVARLNFSHGTHDEHRQVAAHLRDISGECKQPIGILVDLSGPKIRLGEVEGDMFTVTRGDEIVLTSEPVVGTSSRISVSYPHLGEDVRIGDPILIADGTIRARVVALQEGDVVCRIEKGGKLSRHKGVNFPLTPLRVPSLTDKDRDDLNIALELGAEFIALSFVRHADDVKLLRTLVEQSDHQPMLVAKIEKQEALANFDAILDVADAIMIARGDLGVETDLARVPVVQKELIRRARTSAKPVITATQMLESMVDHPMPTRAEVADVANAILDGTDAVMLSEETAIGEYPIETVNMMSEIIGQTEASDDAAAGVRRAVDRQDFSVTEALGNAAAVISHDLDMSAILVSTATGRTARAVSRFRPNAPILAGTPNRTVARQLTLSWGVVPLLLPQVHSTDELVDEALAAANTTSLVAAGDRVLITAGVPFGTGEGTNLLMVRTLA